MTDKTSDTEYRRIELLSAYVNSMRDVVRHIEDTLKLVEQETGLSAGEAARSPLAHHESGTIDRARTFARHSLITSDFANRFYKSATLAHALANRLSEATIGNDGRLPLLDTGIAPGDFPVGYDYVSARFCTVFCDGDTVVSSNPTVAREELLK